MSFLNENEKQRLQRLSPGSDTDSLIEELTAMANDTQRQEFPNGIDVTPDKPGVTPIVADFPNDNQSHSIFTVNRGNDSFSLSINADNSLTFGNGAVNQPVGGTGSTSTNVFPGQVTGYSGSNNYTVTIFPRGTSEPGVSVTVKQLQGDPLFPFAVDGSVWATVMKNGSQYSMSLPVWG